MVRSIDIKSERGEIVDAKGKKWAVNENTASVWYNPDGVSKEIPEGKTESYFDEVCRTVAEIMSLPIEQVRTELGEATTSVKIGGWATPEQAMALRELKYTCLTVVDDKKRIYPNGELAADILGFTNMDHEGLYGVEASYNFDLSGVPGQWSKQTDLFNRQMALTSERKLNPTNGNTIVTTIDETIQSILHEEAKKAYYDFQAKRVTILMQDPKTGFMMGMANYPTYDPNQPRAARDPQEAAQWASMPEEEVLNQWYEMWKNPAISNIYEPGSTFKTITAAAALEEAKSSPEQHYYCSGVVRDLPEVELRCAVYPNAHGDISLRQALEQSCNVAFVSLGRHMGPKLMYKYLRAFGFGSLTGIDIAGEGEGLIPASPESMAEVDVATMSYGHGFSVTPIQMINGLTSVINGGRLMTPRVIQEIRDQNGDVIKTYEPEMKRQVLSDTTSNEMRDMLEGVVTAGSGKRAQVPGYRVGGKTGTADKVIDGKVGQGRYIASFFGFAPVEDPRFSLLVVIDDPSSGQYYGGVTAAPVAQRVMVQTLEYLDQGAPQPVNEQSGEMTIVPYVVDLKLEDAGRLLVKAGLRMEVEFNEQNDRAVVAGQLIPAGTSVPKGTVVDLSLRYPEALIEDEQVDQEATTPMPSLIGLSKAQALQELQPLVLQVNVEGEGRVVSQEPGANTPVKEGDTVTIRCED